MVETKTAILPNAIDGTPTRHRYVDSRKIRVPDKIGKDGKPTPDFALGHFYQCEDTKAERLWGSENLVVS